MNPPQGTGFQPPFRTYKVTRAFGSALFNAAATTDSEAIWTQPANTLLIFADITVDVPFVASGLMSLTVNVGTAGSQEGIVPESDLFGQSAGARFVTKGGLFDSTAGILVAAEATAYTAYVNSSGANLNTLSAGQATFTFITIERGA